MCIMNMGTNLPTSPAMLTLSTKRKTVEFSHILRSIAFNLVFFRTTNITCMCTAKNWKYY